VAERVVHPAKKSDERAAKVFQLFARLFVRDFSTVFLREAKIIAPFYNSHGLLAFGHQPFYSSVGRAADSKRSTTTFTQSGHGIKRPSL
jgi:hypothetical protein